MRFYRIEITDQAGLPVVINGQPMTFTSHDSFGNVKRGALNVEWDLPVTSAEIPIGNGFVKIWGIDLSTLNNASMLNLMNIKILAGMKKGLPLANEQVTASPIRNSIIFEGSIFQAFGNWQGNEQSIDLIVTVQLTPKPQDKPQISKPMVFSCLSGQSFQGAIQQAMQSAGIVSHVAVSPMLTPAEPIIFQADTVNSFASSLFDQSKRVMRDNSYLGIKTVKIPGGYSCVDNSTPTSPISVNFNDLIGQPTWLDYLTVQMKLVMRSDISVASSITMPSAVLLNKAKTFGVVKENIAFVGTGWVQRVRHVANYRQQDANSWVTIVDSILNTYTPP